MAKEYTNAFDEVQRKTLLYYSTYSKKCTTIKFYYCAVSIVVWEREAVNQLDACSSNRMLQ